MVSLKALVLCVSFSAVILAMPALFAPLFPPANREGVYLTAWGWLGGWFAGSFLYVVLNRIRPMVHPNLVHEFTRHRVASAIFTLISLVILAIGIFVAGVAGQRNPVSLFILMTAITQTVWQCYWAPKAAESKSPA